jgi:hypothetical protein
VLALQRDAGNTAVTSWLLRDTYTPHEPPLLSQPPPGLTAEIVGDLGATVVFGAPVTHGQAMLYLWGRPPGDSAVIRPDPKSASEGGRHTRFHLRLGAEGDLVERLRADLRAPYLAAETKRQEAAHHASGERAPLGDLLARLDLLADTAKSEKDGPAFQKAVADFRMTLRTRVDQLAPEQPLPADLKIVMQALMLWSQDGGEQWGEGVWDSDELVMSAHEYARVPASQYKCNAYVAETLYRSLGLVFKVHAQAPPPPGRSDARPRQPTRWFPHRAAEWGDAKQAIPEFPVVAVPQIGDVWSNGGHVGIFLGAYAGKNLYISARDDGDGVFALNKVQHEHGIQIKSFSGGIFRRYTPGAP